MRFLQTSESVTEGHPDKLCDQISDAVLDAIFADDPTARVACETLVTRGLVFVTGEITTSSYVDIQAIVRNTVREVGYTDSDYGFDANTCGVIVSINEQSPDIKSGVDEAEEIRGEGAADAIANLGAGDQGSMVGYACRETEDALGIDNVFMPLPIYLSHRLAEKLAEVRKNGRSPISGPMENPRSPSNTRTARFDASTASRWPPSMTRKSAMKRFAATSMNWSFGKSCRTT